MTYLSIFRRPIFPCNGWCLWWTPLQDVNNPKKTANNQAQLFPAKVTMREKNRCHKSTSDPHPHPFFRLVIPQIVLLTPGRKGAFSTKKCTFFLSPNENIRPLISHLHFQKPTFFIFSNPKSCHDRVFHFGRLRIPN